MGDSDQIQGSFQFSNAAVKELIIKPVKLVLILAA